MPDRASGAAATHAPVYSCRRFNDLGPDELDEWQALCDSDPGQSSPLLGPEFAALVAGEREDVRILTARRGGALVGLLAVHKRPFGHARPIGAPFCDYCGPLLAPGKSLSLPDMLAAGGLSSYHAPAAVVPPERLGDVSVQAEDHAFVIRLDGRAPEAYIETFRARHAKRHKNFRRLLRQLERGQDGELKLAWGVPEADNLATLLAWKSAQFRGDGLLDVTAAPNSARLLKAAAALEPADSNGLQGFMISLTLGNTLLAGHFGVRRGEQFHPWIAAYNPDHGEHAPGILLIYKAIAMMDEMGLQSIDLSGGHDHYKKYFAAPLKPTWNIRAHAQGVRSGAGTLQRAAWRLAGAGRENAIAARLRRRLDHIAACEPALTGRVGQFVTALRKRS